MGEFGSLTLHMNLEIAGPVDHVEIRTVLDTVTTVVYGNLQLLPEYSKYVACGRLWFTVISNNVRKWCPMRDPQCAVIPCPLSR